MSQNPDPSIPRRDLPENSGRPAPARPGMDRGTLLLVAALVLVIGLPILGMWLGGRNRTDKLPSDTPGSSTPSTQATQKPATPPAPPVVAAPIEEKAAEGLVHTLNVPLKEGRIEVGQLLGALADQFGMEGQAIASKVKVALDMDGPVAAILMSQLEQFSRDIVSFEVNDDRVAITLDRVKLRREEKALRSRLRTIIGTLYPSAAAEAAARYGIRVYRAPDQEPVRLEDLKAGDLPENMVLLVHGVDDPGLVWNTLRPTLLEAGWCVAQMEYPNDGPIDAAAVLTAAQLEKLVPLGTKRISVVAHSMGGLIARHVLTDPRWYGGRGTGHANYPDITRLIMVAVPQHGSQMARLRLVAEVRDQLARTLSGDGMLFGGIFDGAGEAKIDLLPGSDFLKALNSRPHPQGVKLTSIAGRASPLTPQRVGSAMEKLKGLVTDPADLESLAGTLEELSQSLGDGAVSLASAKLEGVEDFVVVEGNHLSMVRNIRQSSDRVPPAMPIILERLGKP